MRISTKLTVSFAIVIAAMLSISAVSLVMLTRLSNEWSQMSSVIAKRSELMLRASMHLGAGTLNFRNFIFRGGDYADRFMGEMSALEKLVETYKTLGEISEEEKNMLEGASLYIGQYRNSMETVRQKRTDKADLMMLDFTSQTDEKILGSILEKLTEMGNERAEKASREITQLIRSARIWLIGIALVAVAIAIVIALSLVRAITRPLAESVEVADRVAAGDLSASVESRGNDETGKLMDALRGMNDGLARIVGEVRTGAHAIADAVGQLVVGHNDLSRRTEAQAASLEQTSSSMEEFNASVRQTASNASKADQLAKNTSAVAKQGDEVMKRLVENMELLNATSRRVGEITDVIKSIAFQTNILALNAAIEAARAGAQGRGFAVVATEVRALADRCTEAAKEIGQLLGDSTQQIQQSADMAQRASAGMAAIVSEAEKVSGLIGEISASTSEQSEGIGQVTQSVTQLEQVTQQNAALVEEATAATTALSEQAERLAEAVSVFRLAQDDASHSPNEESARRQLPVPSQRYAEQYDEAA